MGRKHYHNWIKKKKGKNEINNCQKSPKKGYQMYEDYTHELLFEGFNFENDICLMVCLFVCFFFLR
jgi:hypothetical protein